MSNVLMIYEGVEPCNIEMVRIFRLLEQKGIISLRNKVFTEIVADDIIWCDIIFSVRSTSNFENNLAKLARKLGKFWILMLDDDFIGLSEHYGKDGEGYWSARKNSLRKLTRHVHCLVAVNELLAEKYVAIGKIPRYAITHTIVEINDLSKPIPITERNLQKVKIALYVNDGTLEMFNQILLPVIPLLCEKYPGSLSLSLIALKPDLSLYKDKIDVIMVPHMAYYDFKKYMANEQFDIGLAPLDQKGFSIYKYFNKYVEYTMAGIPAIYSNCRLYRQVISDGYNGLLSENSSEAWLDAISRFVENPDLRMQCIENAQQHLYDQFCADTVLEKLLEDIPEIKTYQAPAARACRIGIALFFIKFAYGLFRVRGWLHMLSVYVKAGKYTALIARFKKVILKIDENSNQFTRR